MLLVLLLSAEALTCHQRSKQARKSARQVEMCPEERSLLLEYCREKAKSKKKKKILLSKHNPSI